MRRRTEHEPDGQQVEEESEEKTEVRRRNEQRESGGKKQFLAPGPANSSCHSNVLPTTQFSASVHTLMWRDGA